MYPPELLRTFLAVSQSLSFTRAAELLEIRQPTVSQHIRKLEELVGRTLFVRDTRTVRLTADGDALTGFARTILAAQEQAVDYFTGSGLTGRLRVGVTDDLALTPLPKILRQFRQAYPRVDLDLTVAQSPSLHRRIESGHLDVVFVKRGVGERGGQLVRRDRLVWAGPEGARLDLEHPVPLVVYRAPSLTRSAAITALEGAGMTYRIDCTVRGVNGVIAAVRAGLGIGIFARSLIPEELVELPTKTGLPTLGEIDLVLLTNPHAESAPAATLVTAILASGHPSH
ncbi:LysR substrate-binding domain-containing protein [Flexivirga oryzae]|uniref:DNA-binding transcriptional LysR family regulator n=1 Tax=Flexivirga oryzae TaxID=1794944 RepID=A0A839NBE0_9MICO|nr:DNA-binding transcriptional LysR family regulator [Flexivirga oryzae]